MFHTSLKIRTFLPSVLDFVLSYLGFSSFSFNCFRPSFLLSLVMQPFSSHSLAARLLDILCWLVFCVHVFISRYFSYMHKGDHCAPLVVDVAAD